MLSAAAHEFSFKTLAASLDDSLKKIAARLERKEEEGDVSEDEEKEEEEDDEKEEEKRKKMNKKNKTAHTDPDESAKEQ